MHQNDLTGCDRRCLGPKSRGRRDGYGETKNCCSVLSARVYAPANGTVVGLAVLGEEESVHDLEKGSLLVALDAALVEREDDLVLAAEAAVRASGR